MKSENNSESINLRTPNVIFVSPRFIQQDSILHMCWLKSIPANSRLHNVFQAFPETARPLIAYHEALLRGPSPFSAGERELIAAYVSGLNACDYCQDIHAQTAAAFGIDIQTLRALLTDPGSAPVDARLRPVLSFVHKLTLSPSRMTPADAEAVFAAGWDDHALHDAAAICGLFNLMNRLVDGLGIEADGAHTQFAARCLATIGYAGFLPLLPAAKQSHGGSNRFSISELIGITFSELFGISRLRRRSFSQENRSDQLRTCAKYRRNNSAKES
jgi:uncharacterized peroxidase-related enzyme